MIPQAIGFFGWKRPQVAAKTLRGLARCVVPRRCHTLNIGTIDWTHTPGEDLTPEEWAGSENPRDIRQ